MKPVPDRYSPNANPFDDGYYDEVAEPKPTQREADPDAERARLFDQEFELLMKQRRTKP